MEKSTNCWSLKIKKIIRIKIKAIIGDWVTPKEIRIEATIDKIRKIKWIEGKLSNGEIRKAFIWKRKIWQFYRIRKNQSLVITKKKGIGRGNQKIKWKNTTRKRIKRQKR